MIYEKRSATAIVDGGGVGGQVDEGCFASVDSQRAKFVLHAR